MSYCRWSEGDVYVYGTVDNKIVCSVCRLNPSVIPLDLPKDAPDYLLPGDVILDTPMEMLEHLLKHRKSGDTVPERAIERLKLEIAERKEVKDG